MYPGGYNFRECAVTKHEGDPPVSTRLQIDTHSEREALENHLDEVVLT